MFFLIHEIKKWIKYDINTWKGGNVLLKKTEYLKLVFMRAQLKYFYYVLRNFSQRNGNAY